MYNEFDKPYLSKNQCLDLLVKKSAFYQLSWNSNSCRKPRLKICMNLNNMPVYFGDQFNIKVMVPPSMSYNRQFIQRIDI